MPVSYKLGKIFDKTAVTQALSNAVSKTLVEFAAYVPEQQKKSQPSGKTYRRKGGRGFTRSHRASAKGQRPAIDEGVLLKGTRHKKTGQFSGEVTTTRMANGRDIAPILQDKLDRPIQNKPEDVKAGEEMLRKNGEAALKRL